MAGRQYEDSPMAHSKSRYYRFFVIYVIFCSILTLAHMALMLWQQTLVLEELSYPGGSNMAYIQAIPTWLPFAVLLILVAGVQPCLWCSWCCETSTDRKENSKKVMELNCRINIAITLILGVVCHIIQVIVYLWIDILAYLDLKHVTPASCFCFPALPDHCPDLHQCQCSLPLQESQQTVVTDNISLLGTGNTTLDYLGQVNVTLGKDVYDAPKPKTFPHFDIMVLLLQLVLVVITLRFPMWIIMHHKDMLKDKLKLVKKISKDYNLSRKGTKKANWKGVVCATIATNKVHRDHKAKELINAWFVLEVCFYCYVEGADAFTLVEEIMKKSDYFTTDRPLTNALLFFISLTLAITSLANLLSLMPQISNWVSVFTRFIVVTLSNLPLFILRIYMFVVIEHITGADIVFVLFTVKEVVLLVLAVAQAIIEICNAKMEAENKDHALPAFCMRPSETTLETIVEDN